MKILSVDWDYFINASYSDRGRYFPDGGREYANADIMQIVWSGLYAGNNLLKFGVKEKELKLLYEIIRNNRFAYLGLENSHMYMYNFAKTIGKKSPVEIYNIDFHHDIFDHYLGEEGNLLNCGNWFKHLIDEKLVAKGVWVKDRESDLPDNSHGLEISNKLETLKKIKFDAIFFCKSESWTPPHLDKKFKELVEFTAMYHGFTLKENQLPYLKVRYNKEFKEVVKQQKEFYAKSKEDFIKQYGKNV